MRAYKRIKKLDEVVYDLSKNFNRKIVVADIGTDHGYLAERLSRRGNIEKIIATDISEKSLDKLNSLIKKENLKNIETRVGDGLEPIQKVDISVVAGIGGEEIISIIKTQNDINFNEKKCNLFVLQPSHNVIELRKWIFKKNIFVVFDKIIYVADRAYSIIVIDVSKKQKNKISIQNVYLGRDNKIDDEDFVLAIKDMFESLKFIDQIPMIKIMFNKSLKEKFKLKKRIEKLLKEKLC
ncbi:MAG: tRNA (adenine(22)-N(1))-methyltransferase TrmK [Clostridia bacterium]|nr:tRNA (adenine(22)-N(1))-methyltransferase TrmK [Clostridia bacterium]